MSSAVNLRAIRSLVEADTRANRAWAVRPAMVATLLIGLVVMLGTESEHLLSSALAYVNLVICIATVAHFAKQRSLPALMPIAFLMWFALSWPFVSIYAGIFAPTMSYQTIHDLRQYLTGNVRLQLVLLLFLSIYVPIVLTLIQGRRGVAALEAYAPTPHARRLAIVVLLVTLAFIGTNAFSKVRPFPWAIQYVVDASYLYLRGLILVVGVVFPFLPSLARIVALVFLAFSAAFYTLGNAREFAVMPIAMLTCGVLFVSRLSKRWKIAIIGLALLGLPAYLVVGETTRTMLGSVGFRNIERRAEALGRWQEMFSSGGGVTRAFARLFNTGGHTLVTLMPENYPYLEFSAPTYGKEFFANLIPRQIYYKPFYASTGLLKSYDFMITEKTSVELSLVGSLWMLGGYLPVAVGAVGAALVSAALARILDGMCAKSPSAALVFAAVLTPELLWAVNLDPINNFRNIVWRMLAGLVILALVVRPLIGRETLRAAAARAPQRPLRPPAPSAAQE